MLFYFSYKQPRILFIFVAFSLFLFLYLCFLFYNWIANPSLHHNFILIMLFISSQHSVITPLGLWNNQLGADYIKKNTAVINVAEELVGDKSVGKDNGQKMLNLPSYMLSPDSKLIKSSGRESQGIYYIYLTFVSIIDPRSVFFIHCSSTVEERETYQVDGKNGNGFEEGLGSCSLEIG